MYRQNLPRDDSKRSQQSRTGTWLNHHGFFLYKHCAPLFPLRKCCIEKMFVLLSIIFLSWGNRVINDLQTLWIIRTNMKFCQNTNKAHFQFKHHLHAFVLFQCLECCKCARMRFHCKYIWGYCGNAHLRGGNAVHQTWSLLKFHALPRDGASLE